MQFGFANLLTAVRLRPYSSGMISDFELLAHKVDELAALAQQLRRENADLRAQVATLSAANGELSLRMRQAQQRVEALLTRIPVTDEPAVTMAAQPEVA